MRVWLALICALLVPQLASAQRIVVKGTADVSCYIRIIDSATALPETGVNAATGGLDLEYVRVGADPVNLTESDLGSTSAAHSDGGMIHVGHGRYRVDLPDAACATGVNAVYVQGTATDMIVIGETVQLTTFDLQTAIPSVNIFQVSGDSTAADNAELFFDGTGYLGGAIPLDVNILSVSSDTTAAANLEAAYDGAGYVGGTLKPEVNVAQVGGSATPVTNLAIVFNTDFATNYDTTNDMWNVDVTKWLGTAAATPTTAGVPKVEMVSGTMPFNPLWQSYVQQAAADALIAHGTPTLDDLAEGTDLLSTLGLATGNLDTALGLLATQSSVNTIDDLLDTEVGAIQTDVDEILVDTGTTLPDAIDDIEGGGGGTTIPVNQIPVPESRTWVLEAKGTALQAGVIKAYVGDPKLYAVDYRNDLPINGRLVDVESVTIISAIDAEGEEIEDGLTFDLDGADTLGVDKTKTILQIQCVTAGKYEIEIEAEYRDADGGGTSRGRVKLTVVE